MLSLHDGCCQHMHSVDIPAIHLCFGGLWHCNFTRCLGECRGKVTWGCTNSLATLNCRFQNVTTWSDDLGYQETGLCNLVFAEFSFHRGENPTKRVNKQNIPKQNQTHKPSYKQSLCLFFSFLKIFSGLYGVMRNMLNCNVNFIASPSSLHFCSFPIWRTQ